MRVLRYFLRAYPGQTALMLAALLLAAAAEGVGLSTLVPVLGLAFQQVGTPDHAPTGFEATVMATLRRAGIEPTLGSLFAIVTAALWLKGALVLLSKRQVGYTVARAATDLRLNLLHALLASRWSYYTRQPVGAAANAMSTEADRASLAFHHLALIASYAVQTVLYTALALAVSWQATAFAAGAGLATLLVLSFLVRVSGRAGRLQTQSLRSLLSRLTDVLQGVKLLKAMGRERLVAPILEQDTRRLHKALRKRIFTEEAVVALQEPIVGTLLLIGMVAWVTRAGVAVQSAFVLLFLCFKTLDNLNKAQRKYQIMIAEESALVSLLERTEHAQAEREDSSGRKPPTLERGLSLDGVSVGHGGQVVLEGASIEVPAVGITAILGRSGAGKTTIVDLLTGLVRPDAGTVQVDGVPLEDLDLQRWRSMIGYVPQELFLLHDSVRTNVSLGDPELSEADVVAALRDAGALEFVNALPEGLEASVGERGMLLSGGQRQRIAIARAIVHKPRLLILTRRPRPRRGSRAAIWRTVALGKHTAVVAIRISPPWCSSRTACTDPGRQGRIRRAVSCRDPRRRPRAPETARTAPDAPAWPAP
jgi:ATP-binding cassette subfamily C protein